MKSEHYGPFRWRGHLNWKDITERIVSGIFTGFVIGATLWTLTRLFG